MSQFEAPNLNATLKNLDLTDIVEKLDDSKSGFNKRILKIEDGDLMYYSKVPKNFHALDKRVEGMPKSAVPFSAITDILESQANIKKDLQNRIIIIQFMSSDLIEGKKLKAYNVSREQKNQDFGSADLKKTPMEFSIQQENSPIPYDEVKKDDGQRGMKVSWVFLFGTQEIRNRWAEVFARNLQKYSNGSQSEEMRRFIDSQTEQAARQIIIQGQQQKWSEVEGIEQETEEKNQNIDQQESDGELKIKQKQKVNFEMMKQENLFFEKQRRLKEEEKRENLRRQQEEEEKRAAQLSQEQERNRKEEEHSKQRQEQERQMRQKVQTAWEFRYFQALEDYIDVHDQFEESMKNGIKVVKLVETFKQQAIKVVREIIQEMLEVEIRRQVQEKVGYQQEEQDINFQDKKPTSKSIFKKKPQKRIQEQIQESYQETLGDIKDGSYVFHRKNMLIRIACGGTSQKVLFFSKKSNFFRNNHNRFDQDQFLQINEECLLQSTIHNKNNQRDLSNEFKAMNYANDLCLGTRICDKNFRIKVPLACMVQFMGFSALVVARPPCSMDQQSLACGPSVDGSYRSSTKIEKEVELLGRCMAIKPHTFVWNERELNQKKRNAGNEERKAVTHLSYFTEVHVGKFEEFEHLKLMLKVYSEEEIDIFEMRRQGVFYLNNVHDNVPFHIEQRYAELLDVYNSSKLQQEEEMGQAMLYQAITQYTHYKLRPEFLSLYYRTGIKNHINNNILNYYNPDCYETLDDALNVQTDQIELAEVSKHMYYSYLPEFVRKLDTMEIMPLDSFSLRDSLKIFGVNIRMIGLIAKQTTQPHIRSLLEIEMLARSLKNIFVSQVSEEVLNIKDEEIPLKNTEIKNTQLNGHLTDPEDTQPATKNRPKVQRQSLVVPIMKWQQERVTVSDYLDYLFKNVLSDFLNMVFSPLSTFFWDQVVAKQLINDFDYDMEIRIKGISPGALLGALMYNLKVDLSFEPMYICCSTPYPVVTKAEVINNQKLKHYLPSKSYQAFFNTPINAPSNIQQASKELSPKQGRQSQISKLDLVQKVDNFFTPHDVIKIYSCANTYSLDELEVSKLSAKYVFFKQAGNWSLANKALNIRLSLISALHSSQSEHLNMSSIFSESAIAHMKQGDASQSIIRVCLALNKVNWQVIVPSITIPNDYCISFLNQLTRTRLLPKPGMLKPLMVLLDLLVGSSLWNKFVLDVFDLIMFNIEFSLGPQHPLQARVFHLMAQFFTSQKLFDDSKVMYQSQIICLLQSVGQRHRATADAYFEMARFLHEIMESIEESLIYYEKAYITYETVFGLNSGECSRVAVQLAQVFSDCGRFRESLQKCEIALKFQLLTQEPTDLLFRLKYLKTQQLARLKMNAQAKKESEEFIKSILNSYNIIFEREEQEQSTFRRTDTNFNEFSESPIFQHDLLPMNNDSYQIIQEVIRIFYEIYLSEINKEHRNFLYQVFDQVLENFARDGLLEKVQETQVQQKAINLTLKKIKRNQSLQAFHEKIMLNFIESTGGDSNQFVFNFKKDNAHQIYSPFQGQSNFQEAIEDYENLVIALGHNFLCKTFTHLTMQ